MKVIVTFLFSLALTAALPAARDDDNEAAEECRAADCLASNGCFCTSHYSPLATSETPQFVVITSDDAVTDYIYTTYYIPLLANRTNPDGSPVSGTIFVPHEYTDYERVNNIYNLGFEIGVNSISKNSLASYWAEADEEALIEEFGGARELVAHFANIPIDTIRGARTPNLQINGNVTFEAYSKSGLTFDNSWTALSSSTLFPYTLDYLSTQPCSVGVCPNEPFPGLWVFPINNIKGQNDIECNSLFGCYIENPEDADEIYAWILKQFEASYKDSRTPLVLLLNSAWFQYNSGALEAATRFLNYLGTLNDVFLVSQSDVIAWMKNPVPVSEYKPGVQQKTAECTARTCVLAFSETEIRYMKSCVTCPAVYPWLGNPLGLASN